MRPRKSPARSPVDRAESRRRLTLDLALLEAATGIQIKHIPIASSSEGATQLLGGHIDLWMGSVATTQNLVKAGRLRGLAVSSRERMRDFPDVPTFAEKGFPHINVNLIIVMMGPKGLPPSVTKAWENALGTVLARPEIVSALNKVNYDVDFQTGPDKLRKYFSEEVKRFIRSRERKRAVEEVGDFGPVQILISVDSLNLCFPDKGSDVHLRRCPCRPGSSGGKSHPCRPPTGYEIGLGVFPLLNGGRSINRKGHHRVA